jgi:hypothetical protein
MTQNRIMVVLIPFSRNISVSSLESLLFEGGNPVVVQEETTVNFVSLRQILSRKVVSSTPHHIQECLMYKL